MNAAPIVRVRRLTHDFGALRALDEVSFDVERGEIFGLSGTTGAGKTTALRALATLLVPTSGRIEMGGVDLVLEPERIRKRIGFVAGDAGAYAHLTVDEYLTFFAAAHRLALRSSVDRAIELTKLDDLRRENVSRLPKGARLRVHLARALLHNPELLLLDEPMSQLDAVSKAQLHSLFAELREAGKTVLLSDSALPELSKICTSMAVLKKGHLLTVGATSEVIRFLEGQRSSLVPGAHDHGVSSGDGPHRVLVRLLGPAEKALPLVRHMGEVLAVVASGTQLSLDIRGSERQVADLVRRLVEAGFGVVGVRAERGEPEAAFLELSARGQP